LNTWDRLTVGKPFSRVAVHFGDEIEVPRSAAREGGFDACRERLADALRRSEELVNEALRSGGTRW
jgi:lysophospholipid acyltransferase (LPLAT)-like uncharacterized protein